MPDQAPVAVTCMGRVPSTGAGGIFPDGQLVAVHSSVIVVPGLLFHMYQPVAAEAPPYNVPVKDAGTDNPSFELGLSVPASLTGTLYGGASAATGWYMWNNSPGTTMTELCTATSCPSGKIPPAPVDGTRPMHVTATGAWSGIYQVFPATTLASAGLWLDVISGTVIVELLGPGGPIFTTASGPGVIWLP